MSQETRCAAAVREEAALRVSMPRLVDAALCQCVGGHLPGECFWLRPVPRWVWVLGYLQKLPSPSLWALGTLHIADPQETCYRIIGGTLEIIWLSLLSILKKLKVRDGKGLV